MSRRRCWNSEFMDRVAYGTPELGADSAVIDWLDRVVSPRFMQVPTVPACAGGVPRLRSDYFERAAGEGPPKKRKIESPAAAHQPLLWGEGRFVKMHWKR